MAWVVRREVGFWSRACYKANLTVSDITVAYCYLACWAGDRARAEPPSSPGSGTAALG
jgi:hypothetical protein